MLNHHQQLGLFEDHDQDQDQIMSTQMGFYSLPPNNNLALPPLLASSPSPSSSSFKTFTILPSTNDNLHETLLLSSSDHLGGPHLLSLQRSSANLWAWDEEVNNGCLGNGIEKRSGGNEYNYVGDENKRVIGVSTMKMKMKMKMKKIKASNVRRKVREPRFCFKTMTEVDVLNDGYKWRKYGQKVVKNTHHPRSYYRCTQDSCRVKKRVERLAEDPRMVITTYEGRHAHSPSHDLDSPPHDLANFFC